MRDPRINQLAHSLINYSTALKPGEKVLIEVNGFELPLTTALIEAAYQAGGIPFVSIKQGEIQEALLKGATKPQIDAIARYEAQRMKDMDAYIGIRSKDNSYELADLPQAQIELYNKFWMHPVHHDIRVPKTKWVILRYPNHSMAQLAQMPTHKFEDYFFSVCNLDYSKMSRAMDNLVTLMEKTSQVKIIGQGVHLLFHIDNIAAIKCAGECNIPDGEVYTAPIKDSIQGEITYNTPSSYQGITYENIHFKFEQGKIIEATAGANTDRLNQILNSDDGARYIGEFAIGVNPNITKPIFDTLFDEKIMGSFHLTPGACYDQASNGNTSSIHWDLVHIQTPEYGGGEIYFDNRLIRKDGLFVVPELECLNPENLK